MSLEQKLRNFGAGLALALGLWGNNVKSRADIKDFYEYDPKGNTAMFVYGNFESTQNLIIDEGDMIRVFRENDPEQKTIGLYTFTKQDEGDGVYGDIVVWDFQSNQGSPLGFEFLDDPDPSKPLTGTLRDVDEISPDQFIFIPNESKKVDIDVVNKRGIYFLNKYNNGKIVQPIPPDYVFDNPWGNATIKGNPLTFGDEIAVFIDGKLRGQYTWSLDDVNDGLYDMIVYGGNQNSSLLGYKNDLGKILAIRAYDYESGKEYVRVEQKDENGLPFSLHFQGDNLPVRINLNATAELGLIKNPTKIKP